MVLFQAVISYAVGWSFLIHPHLNRSVIALAPSLAGERLDDMVMEESEGGDAHQGQDPEGTAGTHATCASQPGCGYGAAGRQPLRSVCAAGAGLVALPAPDGGFQSPLTSLVCTPCYRAPEVIMSRGGYSSAIDMWSAGCVFGELLQRAAYMGKATTPHLQVSSTRMGQ